MSMLPGSPPSRSLAGRLNLAKRPFVNRRSVSRLAGALWLLAVGLILANAFLYWRNSAGVADGSDQLRQLSAARNLEIDQIDALREQLEGLDLETQNGQVEFLNQRIVERTFPWSRLFDDLVDTMPLEVRLSSLAHRGKDPAERRSRRGRSQSDDPEWMELEIQGQASDPDAVLLFLENLFAHPAFAEPDLLSEAGGAQLLQFNLRTRYRTKRGEDGSKPTISESEAATATARRSLPEVTPSASGDGPIVPVAQSSSEDNEKADFLAAASEAEVSR